MPQILTPTGYREIADCAVGDVVVSAESRTGRRLLNAIQSIQRVDTDEWQRWHAFKDVPDFLSYRINDDFTLFSEQSVFHNDGKVTHAKHLRPGHRIFFRGRPVTVKRIRRIDGKPWHRLEIDGDHTYIGDGLALHNASRFRVGGTATWDASTTTGWAASSGGAGGQSVPGVADTVTFDGSSGGGTCTVNTTVTVVSITCGAFTGTLDFSANNNNVTVSGNAGFNGSGSGARTINLGNGTWNLTGTSSTPWNIITTTNLTLNANSSVIVYSATTASERDFQGGGKTYSTIQFNANSSGGKVLIGNANTFSTFTITGQNTLAFPAGLTTTISNAFTWTGTASAAIGLISDSFNTQSTISVASGSPSITWAAICDMVFSGGATFAATNSLNIGHNSGITITAPSTSGGVSGSRIFSGM